MLISVRLIVNLDNFYNFVESDFWQYVSLSLALKKFCYCIYREGLTQNTHLLQNIFNFTHCLSVIPRSAILSINSKAEILTWDKPEITTLVLQAKTLA